jgi:hypothetical protein
MIFFLLLVFRSALYSFKLKIIVSFTLYLVRFYTEVSLSDVFFLGLRLHFRILINFISRTLALMQVKKLHQEKQLSMMVDKDLGSNYDRVELEEMVQVALLCAQYHPSHRPRMSEVIRMLEGDGLAEKWEASQNVDTPKSVSSEILPPKYMDFAVEEYSFGLEAIELSGPR